MSRSSLKSRAERGPNNISSIFLIRQLISVWPLIQKGFWVFPKIIRKRLEQNSRGSLRDPLLYLAVTSFFLFSYTFLGTPGFVGSLSNDLPFLSVPKGPDQITNANLFLDQDGAGKFDFPPFNVLQKNSFVGVSTPVNISPQVLGSLTGETFGEELKETRNGIIEYIVQPGDTLSFLAEQFDISLNTILLANDLSKGSKLKVGQKLVILPVSGLIHHAKRNETVGGIASLYKAKSSEVISFNDLSSEGDIVIGDILIIPNGQKPPAPTYATAPVQVPLASSYFICPLSSPCKRTQGLHWYNAIDFSNGKCGEPIYAAAQGEVLKVKYGWNSGAGNYISILHLNGVVTTYGHISSSSVSPGQEVSQGQMIATVGGKPGTSGAGISTGCHVHFGVRGARNPFSR